MAEDTVDEHMTKRTHWWWQRVERNLFIFVAFGLFTYLNQNRVNNKHEFKLFKKTAARSNRKNAMIVMSDSRALDIDGYHKLAFSINLHYAKIHGYAIRYVHTPCLSNEEAVIDIDNTPNEDGHNKTCVACIHEKYGGRSAPWCKVKAIEHIMNEYKHIQYIIFIDSDAFVNKLNEQIHNKSHYFVKTLNMFRQKSKNEQYCSGIQLWNNTVTARRMIQAWWDSNVHLHYNDHHDYEQSVVRNGTMGHQPLLEQYRHEIHAIEEDVREFNNPRSTGFFRHITKKENNTRYRRMTEFMKENDIKLLKEDLIEDIMNNAKSFAMERLFFLS